MRRAVLLVASLAFSVSGANAENLLVNGNFDNGLAMWTIASPETVTQWQGGKPVPAQSFSDKAPMHVMFLEFAQRGARFTKPIGLADAKAYHQWSAGWTRSGAYEMGHRWMSQILHTAPGKYLVNASWRVCAWHHKSGSQPLIGGAFLVRTDEEVHSGKPVSKTLEETVWDHESQGKWIGKTVKDFPVETRTGYLQVCLVMRDEDKRVIEPPGYAYVAFDEVSVELVPVYAE